MRHLPYCQTFCTEHYEHAWLAIAEAMAYIREAEQKDNVTVILFDVQMDMDALYYVHFVVEFGDEILKTVFG